MEAKVGDQVSIDAKKVGQPRRVGVVVTVAKGLSGVRYQVRWDDGHESMLSPGGGTLLIEGRSTNGKRASRAKSKFKPKAKVKVKASTKKKRAKR